MGVEDEMAGRSSELTIRVSAAGTLFVHVPAVGRVGVGFGPIAAAWRLPNAPLLP